MIRHLFMGAFKDGISEEIKQREIEDLRAMKDKIPGIVELRVGRTTGWVGRADVIMMTVDMATKEDFDVYLRHPYHTEHIAKTGLEYCLPETFVIGQIEF